MIATDQKIGQADGRECKKCGEWKLYIEFYKHPFGEAGRDSKCKECAKEYARLRRIEPETREKILEYDRERRDSEEYRAERRARMKIKRATNINLKMSTRMRGFITRCVDQFGMSKLASTSEILGYTPEMLRGRMECQFKAGMSWSNYGRSGWHIDHKKPIMAFFNQGITCIKTINALCNLQPMWAEDNVSKGWSWPLGSNDNLRRSDAARRLLAANTNTPAKEAA